MKYMPAIPGNSLTDEPGGYKWERPPATSDPDEAVMMHIERLNRPETLDAVVFMHQAEMPVRTMAKAILSGAVGEGIHSVDVSLIIQPVIEEELVSIAKDANVGYKMEFDNSKAERELEEAKVKELLEIRMRKNKGNVDEEIVDETIEAMESPQVSDMRGPEDVQEIAPEGVDEAPVQTGLMSRGAA